jgi:hypothetical protein
MSENVTAVGLMPTKVSVERIHGELSRLTGSKVAVDHLVS